MTESTWNLELRKDPALVRFLGSLARSRPLSEEELDRLAARIQRGDRSAVDRLVRAHRHLVVELARDIISRQRCRILGAMDLIAEGNVALLAAARRVQEWADRPFAAVATGRIRTRMFEALREEADRLMGADDGGHLTHGEYQTVLGMVSDRDLATVCARSHSLHG